MRGKAREAVAVEFDLADFIGQRAAQAIHQRRLSGAVRADQSDALARRNAEVNVIERDKAAETLAKSRDLEQGRVHDFFRNAFCTTPTIPFGATITNVTSSRPTISTLTADEIVTVATCCSVPSSIAPTSGPIQLAVPPMIGMAIEFTAYSNPNTALGCT